MDRLRAYIMGPLLGVVFMAFMIGALMPEPAPAMKNSTEAAIEEALRLGEEFGVVVGEVDEETREYLGLQRAEGVVVYEVIAGRPADLAGIKVKAVIKEIDKYEIRTLEDFGRALKAVRATENFTVATYEPADPDNQGLAGGVNFHFVRTEKD
jgi:C-terminal processing protease CtpA/Prc